MVRCERCGKENPDDARFCSNCAAPLAARPAREERKVVTVLFADLVGFTSRSERLDPEDVRALLSPYYARLRHELERHGGTVEKFIGDAVMALFGAPVAHEDDPERAVRAALAIRDALAEEGRLELRIGIATGEALVALGARPSEGEGMASGDVVNTAARFQSAASVNSILVGESTYRATRGKIDFREHEPVEAKGKSEPVPVWEAVEARSRVGVEVGSFATELVGRERDVDTLVGAFQRTRAERAPQLVTIVGVPGIGKSRLVAELFAVVEADPEIMYWRQGRSLPYGDVAYAALTDVVKAHAGMLETDTTEDAEAKLRRALAPLLRETELDWVLRHVRPLVGLGGDDVTTDRRQEAFAAWRRLVEAIAEDAPLVLVVEDLHWADEPLLDFVDELVDWVADVPLLVVCTTRPELLERRPDWGGGKRNASTVSLAPLSDDDTARLFAALLETSVLPAETQAALLARAGGNPLYAEQYALMYRERGDSVSLEPPETLQGIIAARLDALAPAEKELLQDGAVLGKVFWSGALTRIGDVESDGVEQLLRGLQRKDFVRRNRRSSVAGESEHAFAHGLIRDVAYGQVPRGVRAEKHRRAAEWIESLAPDRAEDRAEMLAHHYEQALDYARATGADDAMLVDRARAALREAGDRASAVFGYATATRHYTRALELTAPDDPDRPQLLLRRANALFYGSILPPADAAEARAALLAAGDAQGVAEIDTLSAFDFWVSGRRDDALALLNRSLAGLREEPASRGKLLVVGNIGRYLSLASSYDEGVRVNGEALEMAEELGDEEMQAFALNNLGISLLGTGNVAGVEKLEQAIEIAKRLGSPEIVRAYGNLASMFGNLGYLERSWELHVLALEMVTRFGTVDARRWMWAERVAELYHRGQWDQAVDQAASVLLSGDPHFMDVPVRNIRALIATAGGDLGAAAEDIRAAAAFVARSKTPEPQLLFEVLAGRARIATEAGDSIEAGAALDELVERSRAGEAVHFAAEWLGNAAPAFLDAGRADELASMVAKVTMPTRWAEAAASYAEGDFDAAAAMFAGIGSKPAEAEATLRSARAHFVAGRHREANERLLAALAFYRSVGASRYVRAAESLLPASA